MAKTNLETQIELVERQIREASRIGAPWLETAKLQDYRTKLLNRAAEFAAQSYNQNANNSWQTDPRSGKTEYAQIAPKAWDYLTSDTATGQRLKQEYQAMMDQAASRRTVKYSTHVIPPPPTQCLIQFIGGPKNAEQEYIPYNTLPNPVDLMTFNTNVALPTIETGKDGSIRTIPGTSESAVYRMTPIPMEQTPFSDAQIIVAVFQELKTA